MLKTLNDRYASRHLRESTFGLRATVGNFGGSEQGQAEVNLRVEKLNQSPLAALPDFLQVRETITYFATAPAPCTIVIFHRIFGRLTKKEKRACV
jgi:hypothetical protein